MYKIIGADQKEYGPLSIDQMREYIAQGRVIATTNVLAEGSDAWQPLSSYPELAAMLPPVGNVPPSVYGTQDGRPLKSKLVAGLLGIFLGWCGVHRFYLGYTTIGVFQIVVTLCTFGYGSLWGFIEGILIIAGRGIITDASGRPLRD